VDDGVSPGRLLIIGGAEDRCCGAGLLERFVELCGGERARIVLVTTATGRPDQVSAEYEQVFRKLGVETMSELRLRERLADGLVVAGTSAGATAMGTTMILGGQSPEVSAAAVRTGPGLGLVPRALIDMHFGARGRLPRLLSAVARNPGQLGIGIDENTAILVEGTSFEVLGTGVASVVDAQSATVVHPAWDCDPITLFGVRLHLLPHGGLFDFVTRTPAIGPGHDQY
jgi:cyanophycinase